MTHLKEQEHYQIFVNKLKRQVLEKDSEKELLQLKLKYIYL
jgi:hypothetical protein